jgi:hypothetical protein
MAYSPKQCPECGATFAPRSGRQMFCSIEHKVAFHRLMANRGQLMLPLSWAWQAGNRSGDRHAAWSRGQQDALLRRWVREDKAAGRDPSILTRLKQETKWSHVDAETA